VLRVRSLVRIPHTDLPELRKVAGGDASPADVEAILRAAVGNLGGGELGDAAAATFGLSSGARDRPAKDRRRRAALVYGVSVEQFRKSHERIVIEQVAEELLKLYLRVDLPPAGDDVKIDDDTTNLLLRIYIPSERLYAAEAHELLSLFRDWLIATWGRGIRQAGYHTALGEMYEFFADASVLDSDLHNEFNRFSDFLGLCTGNPSAAVDMLAAGKLGRVSSADLVARFAKEVRRLQIDLRHERERRILSIRHDIEEQLLESGFDLPEGGSSDISTLLEHLVPGATTSASLAILAAPWSVSAPTTVIVNIEPQIISAIESTIIQNVQGDREPWTPGQGASGAH
jgi:hypothetical protein